MVDGLVKYLTWNTTNIYAAEYQWYECLLVCVMY